MSVVIDNSSSGSFLSDVTNLKDAIGIDDHELQEWKYLIHSSFCFRRSSNEIKYFEYRV